LRPFAGQKAQERLKGHQVPDSARQGPPVEDQATQLKEKGDCIWYAPRPAQAPQSPLRRPQGLRLNHFSF